MLLYHFSEEPDIEIFIPRKMEARKEFPAVVWAIDEEHAVNYYFPRECPRIVYSKSENMSEWDVEKFFGGTVADTIVAVESGWMGRMKSTKLFRYSFDGSAFEMQDETAGYYISEETVKPLSVEPVGDLMQEIVNQGVELRVTPNLYPLRDMILSSTIDRFSIIRFRNAIMPST